ncbi:MAG: dynamin family protein, partial [Comamonas sp.]
MTVISTDEAIKALRAEALRLLNNQKHLLQRVSDEVASVDQEDGGGEYTVEGIRKKILSLEENKKLLEKMEMVLVVVGTMKAGKSTCINAIVGREVLPSRNRPMTALPTLIRHKKGVVVPKLYFSQSKQQPLQVLLSKIKSKLLNQDLEAIENVKGDDVLRKIALEIQNGWSLSEHFEGETEIFEFLSAINDLVRLSKALNIKFPFNEYSGVDDYPVIEVEFTHFKDAANDELTNFSILDTPGFNEAGQEKNLKPMLQKQ